MSTNLSVEFGVHLDGAPLTDRFVDRPLEIQQLWERLVPRSDDIRRRVVVVHGEAGVGKSQLSIEFVRRYATDFSSVFWVDGTTEESLTWRIATLQRHLKGHEFSPEAQLYTRSSAHLRRAVVGLLRWFSIKENNRWLLIIDGLMTEALSSDDDVQTVKLESFLPTADQGSVLITTRSVQEGHKYDYALKLETLGIEQAESLIAEKNRKQWQVRCDRVKDGGRYVAYSSIELGPPDQIKESLNLLEKSPIAIKQAGSFIRETKSTISGYLQRYKSALGQLRQLGCVLETPLDTPPKEPVLVTTTISYDHISTEAETAAKFLKLWTYLDNRDLWYQLFTPDDPLLAQSESLWWFRWAIRTPEGFEKAMHTLKAYGMIQSKENSSGYFLHPVIHECDVWTISKDKDPEFAWLAVRTVGRVTPSGSSEDELCLKQ